MFEDTQGSGADEVTQDSTPYEGAELQYETIEKLESERKKAITESIDNFKQAKTAKAELVYEKKKNSVMRNPDSLISIHDEAPELADKLAQDVFSKSYEELINEASGKKSDTNVQQEVEKALDARDRKREKVKIEEFEDKFFEEKNIELGTDDYNRIIRVYNKFSPDTLEKATDLLEMAHNKVKGTKKPVDMTNTPPSPSNAQSSSVKKKDKTVRPSDEQTGVMGILGLSAEDFAKYSNK